jgi:acyl-CoA synthetase (AMP-forming)/AMP-acid ligase II
MKFNNGCHDMHNDLQNYNIAQHLSTIASQSPHRLAMIYANPKKGNQRSYQTLTFKQLDDQSSTIALGLQAIGIQKGQKVVVMVKPGMALFNVVFALFKAGIAPVLVDPGMGRKGLFECLAQAEPDHIIGIAPALIAQNLLGWAKSTIKQKILVDFSTKDRLLTRLLAFGYDHSLSEIEEIGRELLKTQSLNPLAHVKSDDLAAILFTSGSTGTPKGAIYHHGQFWAQVEFLKQMYDFSDFSFDLPTFPLFALFDPALGMTAVFPQMDYSKPVSANPQNIFDCIEDFGVSHLFCSPALLKKLSFAVEDQKHALPTLKRVISAGAAVGIAEMHRLSQWMAKNAEISTPYGATESLPVAYISNLELLAGDCRYPIDQYAQIAYKLNLDPEFSSRYQLVALDQDLITPVMMPLESEFNLAFANLIGRGICVGYVVAGVDAKIIEITDESIADIHLKNGQVGIQDGQGLRLAKPFEIGEIIVSSPATTTGYANRPDADAISKIYLKDDHAHKQTDDNRPKHSMFYHRMGDVGYFDDQSRLWLCGRKSHRVDFNGKRYFSQLCEGIFDSHPDVKRSALSATALGPVICIELKDHQVWNQSLENSLKTLADAHPFTQGISLFMKVDQFPVDTRHNAKIKREVLSLKAAQFFKTSPLQKITKTEQDHA